MCVGSAYSNFIVALCIDLTKTFDSVVHEILFNKLNAIGISGPALRLIPNYLLDRKQIVCLPGSYSQPIKTNTGVQQGSILRTLLFAIYINDLPLFNIF